MATAINDSFFDGRVTDCAAHFKTREKPTTPSVIPALPSFKVKVVETIKQTTIEEREKILRAANFNLFNVASDDVSIGREHNRLFRNDDGKFTDVAVGMGVDATEDGRSTIFFDIDLDGDLDLLVSNMDQTVRLYRNERGNRRNWLKVNPQSRRGNALSVGAVVRVTVGDRVMVRSVSAGQGFQTSYCGPLHFGLGDAEVVDQVEVVFPGGERRSQYDVPPNQTVDVTL